MLLIFLGYLLISFNIPIGPVDILPDFLGFILMFAGLSKMAGESAHFAKARPWTLVMTVVSLGTMAAGIAGVDMHRPWLIGLNMLTVLLLMYILWRIVEGLRQIEENRGFQLMAGKLRNVWIILAVIQAVSAVLVLIPSGFLAGIVGMGAFASIIINLVFIIYLYKVYALYRIQTEEER